MRLFSNAKQPVREFMTDRQNIQRLFYVILMFFYALIYVLIRPEETSMLATAITLLASPIIVYPFYSRICGFVFVRNWFYLVYMFVSMFFYFYGIILIGSNFEYNPGQYEISHYILSMVFGYFVGVIVSFPFKLIHMTLYDKDFYYSEGFLSKLEKEAFPEKFKEENKKKAETFKFDNMNETQLNAELNLAVKEDRFEDAEKIRKVLERKFR